MRRSEAAWMMDLAADEGWNPGLDDAAIYFATDPDGFLVGELDARPVGCIAAVAYDAAFGFIGLYIVNPDQRGRGYGLRLWQAAMERLGERNVGLDGVVAQQPNYRRSGFEPAYRQVRHAGIADARDATGAVPLSQVPLGALLDYDGRHFPAPRPQFLRAWLGQRHATSYASLDGSGRLAGYGVIRRCRTGHKVGPLFADTPAAAEELLAALVATVPGETVFLDTPEVNAGAMRLARDFGMEPVFETARMYTRGDPGFPVGNVYGVTSFELG